MTVIGAGAYRGWAIEEASPHSDWMDERKARRSELVAQQEEQKQEPEQEAILKMGP